VDFELQATNILKKDMSDAEKTQFDVQFASRRKNPALALILSLFLGQFGIDRFYLGHIGLGVGKLLTIGAGPVGGHRLVPRHGCHSQVEHQACSGNPRRHVGRTPKASVARGGVAFRFENPPLAGQGSTR
jgi:hypothetical protein